MAQRTPQLPQTFPYRLVAGGRVLDQRLDAVCWGLYVSNYTAQWVEIPEANEFVPPNTRQIIALPGVMVARAKFAAPPGISQPVAINGQAALLTYTERVVQPSGGVVGASALASQVTLERFAQAGLPAAGNAGRIVLLTDYDEGVWKDTGTQWVSIEGEIFNVKQLGAIGDGLTDDTTAIQTALTRAGAVAGAGGRAGAVVYFPPGTYRVTAALTWPAQVDIRGSGIFSSRINVEGAGHNAIEALDAGPAFAISGEISDLWIQSWTGATLGGLMTSFRQKTRIVRCTINDFTQCGISLDHTIMASVESCGLGGNGDATHGQLEVDHSTTFHWYKTYISGSHVTTRSGLRIDRSGPFSIIGGAIESTGIPLELCSKAEAVAGVGPGQVFAIDLENPNNGAITFIELGSGWAGGAGQGVTRVSFLNVTVSISGSATVTRFIRAVQSDTIHVAGCSIGLAAGNVALDLVGAVGNNLRWSTGVNGGASTVIFVQQNAVTRDDARPDQPWELLGRQIVYSQKILALNSATPDVAGYSLAFTNSGIATAITNITGGVAGQVLYLQATDVNTTLNNTAGGVGQLRMCGAANLLLTVGHVYEFIYANNIWNQICVANN